MKLELSDEERKKKSEIWIKGMKEQALKALYIYSRIPDPDEDKKLKKMREEIYQYIEFLKNIKDIFRD